MDLLTYLLTYLLLCLFLWGQLGLHLTISPAPRPTSVLSGIFIHPTVWPQYTRVTDRTDRQDRQDNSPVAQGEPLLVTVARKLNLT